MVLLSCRAADSSVSRRVNYGEQQRRRFDHHLLTEESHAALHFHPPSLRPRSFLSSVSLRNCGHDRTSQPRLFFRLLALWPYRTRLRCVPAFNTSFWRAAGCHRVSVRVGEDSGSNHHDATRNPFIMLHIRCCFGLCLHTASNNTGALQKCCCRLILACCRYAV